MKFSRFHTVHAFLLALLVSALLILRQYIDYLINDYGYDFSWFAVSARILINYLLWASFFTALMRIATYFRQRKNNWKTISLHILASILVAGLHRVTSVRLYDFAYYLNSGFLRDFLTPGNKVSMSAGFFSSFLEFWIIMMLIIGITYYISYAQQQKELTAAKLNALQMQLHPHFLFNTLNSITSLIDIEPKKAQKMLTQLGYLMRGILEQDERHLISLESEMEYIKAYLEIEHIRFQDRLSIDFSIEKDISQAQIPALLLQPIVENAIKHGISKHPDGGEISVAASKLNGSKISIEISNDYLVSTMQKVDGYGIGTANVSKRLNQLYGDQHTFTQEQHGAKYITKITLPYHEE